MERLLVTNSELIVTKVDSRKPYRRLRFPSEFPGYTPKKGCLSDEGTDWRLDISPVFVQSQKGFTMPPPRSSDCPPPAPPVWRSTDDEEKSRVSDGDDARAQEDDAVTITPAAELCVATLNKEESLEGFPAGGKCTNGPTDQRNFEDRQSAVLVSETQIVFPCRLCGVELPSLSQVVRHTRWCRGRRPDSVPDENNQRTLHELRRRTGDKPYKCHVCKRRATEPSTPSRQRLARERRNCALCECKPSPVGKQRKLTCQCRSDTDHRHHDDRRRRRQPASFPCHVCGKKDTVDLAGLTRHIQTDHPHLVSLYNPSD